MYSAKLKKQALDRAQQDGVTVTTRNLGLHKSPLYAWRHKARLNNQTTEEQWLPMGDNARLKRDVVRLENE